jgi:hypothetical protein
MAPEGLECRAVGQPSELEAATWGAIRPGTLDMVESALAHKVAQVASGWRNENAPGLVIQGRLHEWHGWPGAKQIGWRRVLHLAGCFLSQ